MTSRNFSVNDQLAFASLSGDFNPIHVNPIAARRELHGSTVVHGIHLLLWGLDRWSARFVGHFSITQLDVDFARPVMVGAEVAFLLDELVGNHCTIKLFTGGVQVVNINLKFNHCYAKYVNLPGAPSRTPCNILTVQDLLGRSGNVKLNYDAFVVEQMFPALVENMPAVQIATLLASTRLVGVECPGVHSIYSELHLSAVSDTKVSELNYIVSRFDKRFNLVTMLVEAPDLKGTIKAFLRPAPVQQLECASIRKLVDHALFVGQRALVVGGSRGLGEVISKVLAMSGADVVLTYFLGLDDANAVVADITESNGIARNLRLDVTATDCVAALGNWRPTHLYYMATPRIFVGNRGSFSPEAFTLFSSYYVEGFMRLVDSLKSPCLRGVFYPSSIYLDDKPIDMFEYIAAKCAGEALCDLLQKTNPTVHFTHPRLPRLATDQTNSLMPASSLEPISVLLNLIKIFSENRHEHN